MICKHALNIEAIKPLSYAKKKKKKKKLSYDGEPPVMAVNRERTRGESGCSLSLCGERRNMQKEIHRTETFPSPHGQGISTSK